MTGLRREAPDRAPCLVCCAHYLGCEQVHPTSHQIAAFVSSGIARPIRSSDRHSVTLAHGHSGTRRLSIRASDRRRHHHVIRIVGYSLVPCSQATTQQLTLIT